MASMWSDYRVFWQEFRRNFHTTGAVAPSGRWLGRALARFVREKSDAPRRILEVGPGTGAVTRHVIDGLGDDDQLDLVELNEQFVRRLEHRLEHDSAFQPAARKTRVLHHSVEDLVDEPPYDLIVSGLPLNNFSVELVESLLNSMLGLMRPGATLSFFEYVAVRPMRTMVSGKTQRDRLRGVGRAIDRVLSAHEIRRDLVWPNVPPAWVHHVRRDEAPPSDESCRVHPDAP